MQLSEGLLMRFGAISLCALMLCPLLTSCAQPGFYLVCKGTANFAINDHKPSLTPTTRTLMVEEAKGKIFLQRDDGTFSPACENCELKVSPQSIEWKHDERLSRTEEMHSYSWTIDRTNGHLEGWEADSVPKLQIVRVSHYIMSCEKSSNTPAPKI